MSSRTSRHRRRAPSIQAVFLSIHGAAWISTMIIVAIKSEDHIPPSELWTALPLGISAILVAFRTGRHREEPTPRRHRRPEGQ